MTSTILGPGLADLPLRYTLENETNYDRTEIVGIHALFPDGPNSINEADLTSCYFYLEGGRETLGFGLSRNPSYGNTITSSRYTSTIPWVPSLNAITANSGNILPGSCKLTYVAETGVAVEVFDTPIDATTGRWVFSYGGVNYITTSLINYTTGEITVTFNSIAAGGTANCAPNWFSNTTIYGDGSGAPVRVEYKFANPVKYPTQWTMTRQWPSGRVRQAKAWIGQASGVGMFISKQMQTNLVEGWYPNFPGGTPGYQPITNYLNENPSTLRPFDITRERTRVYLRLGVDDGTVNSNLPTYTQHSEITSGNYWLSSNLTDLNNCSYTADLKSTTAATEYNLVEDVNSSGKGWMKVQQIRTYHMPYTVGSTYTFSAIQRDLFSITSYRYIPHNSRFVHQEIRLGNDYAGADPIEHQFTQAAGTGNGVNRSFSATLTNRYTPGFSGNEHTPLRKGRVEILIDGALVAFDKKGDGNLMRVTNGYVDVYQSNTQFFGTVNYVTGVVSISVPVVVPAPVVGAVISVRYKTYSILIGTVSGTGTITYTSSIKPNQRGSRIRVGSGAAPLMEAWDGAGTLNGNTGYFLPYIADSVVENALVASANLSGSASGTLAHTNIHPGTVEFYTSTSTESYGSTIFCRDNGNGGLVGRGVSSGTINYSTGAYSITFSSTPSAGLNLYVNLRKSNSTTPISGSIDYTSNDYTVNINTTVPANTPIYLEYIRNTSTKNYNPNTYPLSSASYQSWGISYPSTYVSMHCEAGPSYQAQDNGTGFFNLVYSGSNAVNSYVIRVNEVPVTITTIVGSTVEYLHDGSSLPRVFFVFAKNGATTAESNNWLAIKSQKISTIPTLDCYNATKAFGVLEGTIDFISPKQNSNNFNITSRGAGSNEDLVRRDSAPGTAFPNIDSLGYSGYPVGYYHQKANRLAPVDKWFNGDVFSSAAWFGKSIRNNFGFIENYDNGVSSGGAPRVGTDFSGPTLYSQAWQGVRYLYHSSIFPYVRPGMWGWNIAMRSKWEDRAYRNYIQGNPSTGMFSNITASNQTYGNTYGPDFLGRGNKSSYSQGRVSVTNGSTTIQFSNITEEIINFWSTSGYGQTVTYTNNTGSSGMRRIAIKGSDKIYTLTNIQFTSGSYYGTLHTAFTGATSSNVTYGIFSDTRPGQDRGYNPLNPYLALVTKIGTGIYGKQHSIEGDASSHQAHFASHDVWCLSGEWMVWDLVRAVTEWNLTSVKEYNSWQFQQDQMRTSAWFFRTMITGYDAVKALGPKLAFLNDLDFGRADVRYKDAIQVRCHQWANLGARGEMDPMGTITQGGRHRIKDIRLSSSAGAKADWGATANFSSTLPSEGGNGTLTAAQVRYDSDGFYYISVWEIGYLAPWIFAIYRQFKDDASPITPLYTRGETSNTLGEIVWRLFDAYSKFFIDYVYITKRQNTAFRGSPGFYQVALANTPPYNGAWGYIIGPANTSYCLPAIWLQNPVDINGVNRAQDIRPQYVNKVFTFPSNVLNEDYIANQIYWLRGTAHAVQFDGGIQEPIDRLGWPLPNSGWLSAGWSSNSNTTFELSLSPNESAWHFPGIPISTNTGIIPGCEYNPASEEKNCVRLPVYPEAFCSLGSSYDQNSPLVTVTFCFTSLVARYHPDQIIRAKAGDIMNRHIYQSCAMSLIEGTSYGQSPGANPVAVYNIGLPLELNYHSGPITGGFPYEDTFLIPTDRWWDETYARRRRLSSSTGHSNLTTEDIFVINLGNYDIDSYTLDPAKTDIRVVLQYSDGNDVVCQSTVRANASGDYFLYVRMPISLTTGSSVQADSQVAWYVYYGKQGAGLATWTNTNSIQGPMAVDSDTVALWNQNGSVYVDAGPNNWTLESFAGLTPDFADGPFGGAVKFIGDNFDTLYSAYAIQIVQPEVPTTYLGSNFSIEWFYNISIKDIAKNPTANFMLYSMSADGITSLACYIENSTRTMRLVMSSGNSTSGYVVNNLQIPGPHRNIVGTGNGSVSSYSVTVGLLGSTITPGRFSIASTDGLIEGYDDGNGNITGTGISSGTINYSSGALAVTLSANLPPTIVLYSYYNIGSGPNAWVAGFWNHARLSYDGTNFNIYSNGNLRQQTTTSGQLQPIPVGTPTTLSFGAGFSQSTLFTSYATIRLADIRISKVFRGIPRKVTTQLQPSLSAQESINGITVGTKNQSVDAYVSARLLKTQSVSASVQQTDLTKTLAVNADLLLKQGATITATTDATIAVSVDYLSPSIVATLQTSGLKTQQVRASIADYLSVTNNIDALIALQSKVDASVVADVYSNMNMHFSSVTAAVVVQAVRRYSVTAAISVEFNEHRQSLLASVAVPGNVKSIEADATVSLVRNRPQRIESSVATANIKSNNINASVSVDGKITNATVAALVSGSNSISNLSVATIATNGITLAPVAAYVQTVVVYNRNNPVDAYIQLETQPVNVSIVAEVLSSLTPQHSRNVTAFVQRNDLTTSTSVNSSIIVNNKITFIRNNASIIVNNLSISNQIFATVAVVEKVINSALVASVQTTGQVSNTVSALVLSNTDMTISSDITASVMVNNLTTSQSINSTVSTIETKNNILTGYVAGLTSVDIPVFARIEAFDYVIGQTVDATIAITFNKSLPIASSVATRHTHNSVIRANVVIPLEQNLNASGVDYAQGSSIID